MEPWALERFLAHHAGHVWLFCVGSPIKLYLWIANRITTYTGMAVFWRRLKDHPRRTRTFLVWGTAINLASLGALACLFWWIAHRN